MTLRFRLVASLGALLTVGLLAFGLGTYGSYARSQWSALDDQLHRSMPVVSRALLNESSNGTIAPGTGDPQLFVPPGTYGELRDANQNVINRLQLAETTSAPALPAQLQFTDKAITVRSKDGSGSWRVIVQPNARPQPGVATSASSIVIAIPTTSVDRALRRLVVIETGAGAILLLVLSTGSWLILRRGLQPLEHMASSAREISAGDFAKRVSPADANSEVGQLGLALNSMLERIEAAFAQRDATEAKLRRFLADASHELRTPLTSIQGFAELSRMGAASVAAGGTSTVDHDLVISRIEDEATRMRRLVEDLLALARLDETRPYVPEAVDLSIVAAEVCGSAAALDRTRTIELDAPDPVVINGHREHLRQAVSNLVTNAVKHTPPGSAIEVSVTWHERVAEIVVRDHGNGLDPDALEHVFDRFWQADPSRVGSGTGLGLSIVEGIAREHHGTVSAANHPDGGAVFTLRLPTV